MQVKKKTAERLYFQCISFEKALPDAPGRAICAGKKGYSAAMPSPACSIRAMTASEN